MKVTVNVPNGSASLLPAYLEQVTDAIRDLSAMTDMDWSRRTRFSMTFPSESAGLVDGWWKVEP